MPCSRNALAIEMLLSYHYAEKRLVMKHTYWAGLFHIALFALLAVLTPRSLSADPAGHAKSNAIPGERKLFMRAVSCI